MDDAADDTLDLNSDTEEQKMEVDAEVNESQEYDTRSEAGSEDSHHSLSEHSASPAPSGG